MSATDYNVRVQFLTSGSLDNLGNIAAFSVFCEVWANLKAVVSVRGAALLTATQVVQKANYEMAIRYRDDIDDSMLVLIRGKQFTVDIIAPPDGQPVELRMIVSQVDERI